MMCAHCGGPFRKDDRYTSDRHPGKAYCSQRCVLSSDEDQETIVLFRVDNDGVCFAIFPFEPVNRSGTLVSVYARVGGHSSGDLRGMIDTSRPATPEEYRAIERELTGYPYRYKLAIRKRTPRKERKACRA